ncbi:hypothetical protein LUZ61_016911 [Rhynchospora tenuis]|uniref:BING4 C-terminal domain-containing protein n=1 Tax=Rhynchospora tenuis TaxID=198213 RepID=A0AAD5Z6E7_9POAL|nr:hypothetical protein LUZ61_016911 [Rhynchospora tenuis]
MGEKEESNEPQALNPASNQEEGILDKLEKKAKKYLRGNKTNLKNLRDKKLKGQLEVREKIYGNAAKVAARAEEWLKPSEEGLLEPENPLERTYRIQQSSILPEVDVLSVSKAFDMKLPDLGPYTIRYLSNGRYMLLGGQKGHLAMLDVLKMDCVKEFQVRERVRDVVFLQNDQLFAVAQKKFTYIYNRHGTEIHCLKENRHPLKLEYLEKHFLLVGTNNFSQLHYQDISTGQVVANYRTGLGPTSVMCSNRYNSIISLGHSGGKLTMWKPTSGKPLITMLCHQGPITAVAYHPSGNLVATAGMDKKVKIWDLRKFEAIHSIPGHAQTLDFSQKGLLALANGSRVQVWRDKGSQDFGLYMTHGIPKGYQIGTVKFRPYEDVLGLGHSMGFSSILIPGSGEPNFDSWVANPYETNKQRSKKEVRALLDKLPPESIMLDPGSIGMVRERQRKEKLTKKEIEQQMVEAVVEAKGNVEIKNKTKGRNKPSKRAKRKQEEVFNAKKPFLEKQRETKEGPQQKKRRVLLEVAEDLPKSLQRFVKKKTM